MNLIVKSSKWIEGDKEQLFGDEPIKFIDDIDLSQLAFDLGAFKSKSQARKAGRVGPIPSGWTVWNANKLMRAWIWNPSE